MAKPAATRDKVTKVSRCNSPVRASSTKVQKMTDGGGANRPLDQPSRTMISHASASVTGTIRPRAGRMNRVRRLAADRSCAGLPSAAMLMATTDMVNRANAMWRRSFPGRSAVRSGALLNRDRHARGDWKDPGSAVHRCALYRIRETELCHADEAIVDQIV